MKLKHLLYHNQNSCPKSVARRSVTSSCYAHFFKRSAHTRHFTSATATPPVTTVAISNSLTSSLRGFTYEPRPPAHHMSTATKRCCCGCGFLPEEGRKAHICETTGLRLYAGFCQSNEDKGPCRRCAGGKAFKVLK